MKNGTQIECIAHNGKHTGKVVGDAGNGTLRISWADPTDVSNVDYLNEVRTQHLGEYLGTPDSVIRPKTA